MVKMSTLALFLILGESILFFIIRWDDSLRFFRDAFYLKKVKYVLIFSYFVESFTHE